MNRPIVTWVHPILEEPVEQPRAEQRRDHRQHEERDREDQREHGRDGAHSRGQDRACIVDAAHRHPPRDANDAVPVEDVRNYRDPEERNRGHRQLQRDPP
jgi:hypothetical protein